MNISFSRIGMCFLKDSVKLEHRCVKFNSNLEVPQFLVLLDGLGIKYTHNNNEVLLNDENIAIGWDSRKNEEVIILYMNEEEN